MTYKQTKCAVFIGAQVVGFLFLVIGHVGLPFIGQETLPIAILTSVVLMGITGALCWGIVRTAYVENMLATSKLTEKDVRAICAMVDTYEVDETTMDYDIVLMTNSLTNAVEKFTKTDRNELYPICMAAMLLHYKTVLKGKVGHKDVFLCRRMKQYHDKMKMVYHFGHTYF